MISQNDETSLVVTLELCPVPRAPSVGGRDAILFCFYLVGVGNRCRRWRHSTRRDPTVRLIDQTILINYTTVRLSADCQP